MLIADSFIVVILIVRCIPEIGYTLKYTVGYTQFSQYLRGNITMYTCIPEKVVVYGEIFLFLFSLNCCLLFYSYYIIYFFKKLGIQVYIDEIVYIDTGKKLYTRVYTRCIPGTSGIHHMCHQVSVIVKHTIICILFVHQIIKIKAIIKLLFLHRIDHIFNITVRIHFNTHKCFSRFPTCNSL